MDILSKIVADKHIEVALRKSVISSSQLEQSTIFNRQTFSIVDSLKSSNSGIIAEFKRRSPSKSVINQDLNVFDVAKGYELAGACGMSVLTDGKYFGGSLDDLTIARASCNLPLLRKEFIIDEYQILEAKSYGADFILLIAAILTPKELKQFSELAKSIGLEVLLEVHNQEELQRSMMSSIDIIGVNNRNLKTFEVSTKISKILSQLIPDEYVKISESGISNVETIMDLKEFGFQGFLVGENFMRTDDPGLSAQNFIKNIAR
jgi:indole-3-glycerol phosphate synthase